MFLLDDVYLVTLEVRKHFNTIDNWHNSYKIIKDITGSAEVFLVNINHSDY